MKKIGFIGAYDKIDMIIYAAKILTLCNKKVLVVDSTINQKARYVIPTMKQEVAYITDYEGIDIAVGFKNYEQMKQYLQIQSDLPYDVILIDIDNPYNIAGFELNTTEKNFFVSSFDVYSLKRGIQILSLVQNPMKLTKILFSQDVTKEENDYLDYLSLGYKIVWSNERIYFPLENGDLSVITENQRAAKIRFKKLSQQYKESLAIIVEDVAADVGDAQVKKAIRSIERGM